MSFRASHTQQKYNSSLRVLLYPGFPVLKVGQKLFTRPCWRTRFLFFFYIVNWLIFQHASGVQKRSPAGLLEISPELSEAKLGGLGTDDGAPQPGGEDNLDSCDCNGGCVLGYFRSPNRGDRCFMI